MKKTKTTCFLLSLLFYIVLPASAHAQLGYGRSLAIGDDEVFIGEPANQREPGAVYFYVPGPGGWVEAQRLSASDATEEDGFGQAIARGDDAIYIGRVGIGAGTVYISRKDRDGRWVEAGLLKPADGADGDRFGHSVSTEGLLTVVGAPGHDRGNGAAYVYSWDGSRWITAVKLLGDGPGEGAPELSDGEEAKSPDEDTSPSTRATENFGTTVALHGDWLMVGAPGVAGDPFGAGGGPFAGASLRGSVYVFHREDNSWGQVARLSGPNASPGDAFGAAIALRGSEVLIGSPGANHGVGVAYRYSYDESSDEWRPAGSLVPYDGSPGSKFGGALALARDEAFVGAPGASRVFHFTRDKTGDWIGSAKIGITGLRGDALMGGTLAARGDLLVAGVPGEDYGAGTAVVMTRGLGGWDRTRILSDAGGLDPIVGATVPCEDGHAAIFPCDNVDLVSFLPVHEIGGGRGVGTNDLWGWTDPDTGKDYVLIGLRDRTSFVDITDPVEPVFIGSLAKTDDSPASWWRDIKVHEDHAYIVADNAGAHGVQVFDLRKLREYRGEKINFVEDSHYNGIHSAHNIVINDEEDFAFVVGASGGGETCGGGLHMIDIEDPKDPTFAGCFFDDRTGRRGTGYSHDAQCVTYAGPDERYSGHEICIGSNETAVSVADVTDKRNPIAVGMATYPKTAYTHQGWLSEDHSYFYMNDEGDEAAGLVTGTRTLIFDVEELDDPILVGEYVSENPAIDHNIYIRGDLMFQSNYRSGLRVFDISDRENLTPIGYFDTVPWGSDEGGGDPLSAALGSWSNYPFFKSGVVAVASGAEGLFLVKLQESPDEP